MSKQWKAERSKLGMMVWTTGGRSIARVMVESEADLIAAAPELLEALKAAEWHGNIEFIALPKATCPCCGNTRQQDHRSDCILAAAIKKAEGGGS